MARNTAEMIAGMNTDIIRRFFIPLTGSLVITAALAAVFMVQPIFSDIAQSMSMDATSARITFSVVSVVYACSFFIFGPFADRFDYVRMAFTGSAVVALAIVLAAMTSSIGLFLFCMAVIGAGSASMVAPMFPFMKQIAPEGKLGTYMGYCLSATVSGIIVGRTLVGIATDYFGWQTAFLITAVIIFALGLMLILISRKTLNSVSVNSESKQTSLATAYLDSLSLIKRRDILKLMLIGAMLFISYLGVLTFLTYYLEEEPFKLTSAGIGWISLAGIAAVVIAPMAGTFAHKYGANKVVTLGLLLVISSVQIMTWWATIPAVTIGILLLYLGVYICQPAVFYLVTTLVAARSFGSASSLYLLVCLGSGSLASFILGPIWNGFGWGGISLVATLTGICAIVLTSTVKTDGNEQRKL